MACRLVITASPPTLLVLLILANNVVGGGPICSSIEGAHNIEQFLLTSMWGRTTRRRLALVFLGNLPNHTSFQIFRNSFFFTPPPRSEDHRGSQLSQLIFSYYTYLVGPTTSLKVATKDKNERRETELSEQQWRTQFSFGNPFSDNNCNVSVYCLRVTRLTWRVFGREIACLTDNQSHEKEFSARPPPKISASLPVLLYYYLLCVLAIFPE
jgi:hypothetical protein